MANVPCVSLPEFSNNLEVKLPIGVTLKGFADISQGAPSDFTATFNLLGQISPMLGSLSPLLKIINVMKALKDFMEAMMKGPFEAVDKAGAVVKALGEVVPLFGSVTPIQIVPTLKDMLDLITTFLQGFVGEMEALLDAQANLVAGLANAEGNPTLSVNLACAQANLEISQKNLMASLGPIQPLIGMVTDLGSFAQINLGLPDLAAISQGSGGQQAIDDVTQAIDTIKQVLDTLPG